MDLFTRLNTCFYRTTNLSAAIFLQRAYMKAWKLLGPNKTFFTEFGFKMAGNIIDYVPGRVCFFGIWEPNLTRFMQERIKPGDCVIDIGANVGYYTLLMSKLVGDHGSVISVEASGKTFAKLQNNIILNERKNIKALNVAVSSSRGRIKLYDSIFGSANSGMASTIGGGDSFNLVSGVTPDDILSDYLDRLSFIKIDIEGAEAPVLRYLLNNRFKLSERCIVVAEVSPENEAILDDFRAHGFKIDFLDNDYSLQRYMTPLKSAFISSVKTKTSDAVIYH